MTEGHLYRHANRVVQVIRVEPSVLTKKHEFEFIWWTGQYEPEFLWNGKRNPRAGEKIYVHRVLFPGQVVFRILQGPWEDENREYGVCSVHEFKTAVNCNELADVSVS